MNGFFLFIFVLTLSWSASAVNFSLEKAGRDTYETSINKVQAAIFSDDTKQEALPFEQNQSFLLKDHGKQRLGYLIPVKFNSRSYKNTICRVYFLDLDNNLSFAELFAEKNDDNDVVSSCVGVEAASIQDNASNEALYLAVVRYRTANRYGSRAAVLTYKDGKLLHDTKANYCVNANGDTTSIKALKRKVLACM